MGTEGFPQRNYKELIYFETYDFYLIISATRFTEQDTWLVGEVKKIGKKCYFIRTKVDADIDNDKKAHPRTFQREAALDRIIKDCTDKLNKSDQEKTPAIFLISNFDTLEFDFPKLKDSLVTDFPSLLREAILFSLSGQTKNMLEEKKKNAV